MKKLTDREQRQYALKIRSLKEEAKNYDDGEFYIWREENVDDELLEDSIIIDVWLSVHPYDQVMF